MNRSVCGVLWRCCLTFGCVYASNDTELIWFGVKRIHHKYNQVQSIQRQARARSHTDTAMHAADDNTVVIAAIGAEHIICNKEATNRTVTIKEEEFFSSYRCCYRFLALYCCKSFAHRVLWLYLLPYYIFDYVLPHSHFACFMCTQTI